MANIGKARLALVIGFILLAIPLGAALRNYWFAPADTCEARSGAAIPKDAGLLYTDQREFSLNSVLCIAVRAEKYFAAERVEVDAAKSAIQAAEKDIAQAENEPEPAKTQKLQEAKARLETARKAFATADAKLATQPAAKTVYLFIDDARTPSSIDVFISDPKSARDGWTWRTLKVRAPDDAASEAAKQWRLVLSGTPLEGSRKVTLGFGDKADKEGKEGLLPRKDAIMAGPVTLRLYDLPMLICGALGLGLMAAGLIGLGWSTGLLRDAPLAAPPNPPVAPPVGPPQLPPFSLARTQFAWWLFLSIGGFLYIWLTTGQFIGVVTSGVFTLIGISSVSGLAAQVIDNTPNPEPSKGFLMDILSAGGSPVLHRVQMAAWTLILGLIFLWTVLTSFTFPNFDSNLLVLAGIVNGVYLGFKYPEKGAAGAIGH